MRAALAVLILLVAAPAADAAKPVKVRVGAPHAGTIAVKTAKRARLVAVFGGRVVAEARVIRGRGRLRDEPPAPAPSRRSGVISSTCCSPRPNARALP